MVVRILSSAASFNGVNYNTDKIEKDRGELMKVANFGPLQGLDRLRPEDYRNYLKMLAVQNTRVKKPQFHAAISAKGKTYDKAALTEIATRWLVSMGYGEQPYLIICHKDTGNNHVHVVSVRVDRNGKKINSGFENIRAINNLNKVLGLDEKHNAKQDLDKALSYQFSTKAQFMMILESQGYILKEADEKLDIIKFGIKQEEIAFALIHEKIKNYTPDIKRGDQLKAIIIKYAQVYDTSLQPKTIPLPGGFDKKLSAYTSEFSAFLKEKMGVDLVFHAKDGKPPYGYTIIDHAEKRVFKGGEVISLKELLAIPLNRQAIDEKENTFVKESQGPLETSTETKAYYAALLKAALYNYPDLIQGLHHQGLALLDKAGGLILADYGAQAFIPVNELLDEADEQYLKETFSQFTAFEPEQERHPLYVPDVSIASDIDDEAIHSRNRRRKAHPRTNSR